MKDNELFHQFSGFYATPGIFKNSETFGLNNFDFPEIEVNTELVAQLNAIDHPRNSVLGKRMESFFEIAVNHSARYDLIASNIQIIRDKQTLGELDFLIFDNLKNKPLHIELIYKLYICNSENPNAINSWIGPNRRDSLSKKLEKLENQQFPLLHSQSAKIYLEKYGLSAEDVEQQICFKAQLYKSEGLIKQAGLINESCYCGNWYHASEFLKKDWKQNQFYCPQKLSWCATSPEQTQWFDFTTIATQIEQILAREKSPLIWMKTPTGKTHRFFITYW